MYNFHFKLIRTGVTLQDITAHSYDAALEILQSRISNIDMAHTSPFVETTWDYHLMSSTPMELDESLKMWKETT